MDWAGASIGCRSPGFFRNIWTAGWKLSEEVVMTLNKLAAWHAALLFVLILEGCSRHSLIAGAGRVHELYMARHQSAEPTAELGRDLNKLYQDFAQDITPSKLRKLNSQELETLFDAVHQVAFYSEEVEPTLGLGGVYDELAARKTETERHVKDLYRQYAVARLFREARTLSERYPIYRLTPVPTIEESDELLAASAYRVYEVSDDGKSLRLTSASSAIIGARIIVAADPDCSPSGLIGQIDSDPTLQPIFASNALVLGRPELVLRSEQIAEWNKRYSSLKMYIAYRQADWPQVDLGETPVFNLTKDGTLVSRIYGWHPVTEKRRELLRQLKLIGVQVPTAY